MRNRGSMSLIVASAGVLAALALAGATDGYAQSEDDVGAAPAAHFELSSPDFTDGGTMHRKQVNDRCGGENISPALEWRNPPPGTESFALLMHDPDSSEAEGFWHWIVYDIPADSTSLPADSGDVRKKLMPEGVIQGHSDFGTNGYGGPCPPAGKPHSYYFRLYALPVAKLNVPPDATGTIIAAYADASALGRAQLVVRYGR